MKILIWEDILTSMFIAALFTIAKIRKQPKYPLMDERINTHTHTHTEEYYSAIKKEWNLTIHHIDEPRRYYAMWNKSEKDKYHMISLICGI